MVCGAAGLCRGGQGLPDRGICKLPVPGAGGRPAGQHSSHHLVLPKPVLGAGEGRGFTSEGDRGEVGEGMFLHLSKKCPTANGLIK